MTRLRGRALAAAAGAVLLFSLATPAGAQEPVDPKLRSTIEQVLREYLREHPEVVAEALQALQARQREEQRTRAKAAIGAHQKDLLQDPASPVTGNPKGTVTVVEFFDYRCSYCKSVSPTVKRLLAEDRTVRLVYKELPILGPESVAASKAALASVVQGKYDAFHAALMSASPPLTEARVFEIATRTGLDAGKLKAEMESPVIRAALERNLRLAQALGINGTPTFVIGSELAIGALDLARLKELVDKTRK
ncbi:MAG: DsbA family protein [Candidatus Rokubacteria bacterium]|nr:DsbA family protein [Candidatus Rokubacteria bacterium]